MDVISASKFEFDVNTTLGILLNKVISFIKKSQVSSSDNKLNSTVTNNNDFYNIVIELYHDNLYGSINKINEYLSNNNLLNYFEVILDFMKISILENDEYYLKTLKFLSDIKNDRLYDAMANSIQFFYVSLADNDLELTSLYMDVIFKLDELGAICTLKDSIKNIYTLSEKMSKRKIETNRLDKFNAALSDYNSNYVHNTQNNINKPDFVSYNFSELKDLILANKISVDEACLKYNLVGEEAMIFKLMICRELYRNSFEERANSILRSVESTKGKTEKVKKFVSEINSRKRFYKNDCDE